MSGWHLITNADSTPKNPDDVPVEDAILALHEYYGMVWYMAHRLAGIVHGREPTRAEIIKHIEQAALMSTLGRRRGETIR